MVEISFWAVMVLFVWKIRSIWKALVGFCSWWISGHSWEPGEHLSIRVCKKCGRHEKYWESVVWGCDGYEEVKPKAHHPERCK